jgi:hypothetical protein
VALTVKGQSGQTMIVERSTDLSHWVPIHTNAAPFNCTDIGGLNWTKRFYRTTIISP